VARHRFKDGAHQQPLNVGQTLRPAEGGEDASAEQLDFGRVGRAR
jgi:hypothetical protein